MKKITALVLTVLMMVSLFAVPALAGGDELNRAFGFRAQCVSETGGYGYSDEYHAKTGTENFSEVRYAVTGNCWFYQLCWNAQTGYNHVAWG